ncbi:hypothetical protein CDL15_Pgr005740 [Punica granatum]|uniref:PHD-type domain-containing protein n=1 Tax=Punica granatum TaxID=22663 RepID=A0A218WGA4_PUNGR|nr:hypothetical protein CDL15_Pgr005740 [Punica granatum]
MELGGDSDRPRDPNRSPPLGIDLNEIPSSSDSFDVVRTYQDVPDLPQEPPEAPVPARGPITCGACGRREDDGGRVVVCDGCDLVFHMGCAGLRGVGDIDGDEWVCGKCAKDGVKSQGWPLGFKSKRKRVFDMNASPPSDGDGAGEGSTASRKRTLGDIPFGGHQLGSSVRHPNLYAKRGLGFENAPGILSYNLEAGFGDTRHHALMKCKGFEVGFGCPVESMKSHDSSVLRFPHHNPSETFLLDLREHISQRHGILEEGWQVDLKQLNGGIHATYCAPGGEKFDSMSEVASHLGLAPDYKVSEPKAGSQGSSLLEKFHMPGKRKPARSTVTNGFNETKEFLLQAYYKEFLSNSQRIEANAGNNANAIKPSEAGAEDSTDFGSQQSIMRKFVRDGEYVLDIFCVSSSKPIFWPEISDGLPVQFEDFFLLSLGAIDSRPSYHELDQIWPVGYRSCWHDKITGSLFFCDVSDGGESGPVFKIRRCSCSAESVPNGSVISIQPALRQSAYQEGEGSGSCNSISELDGDDNIQSILSDPLPPTTNEISTFFDKIPTKACGVPGYAMQVEASSGLERSGAFSCDQLEFKDAIGEIVVEERSSLLAWKKMSEKLADAFSDLRGSKCSVQLFCKHVGHETFSLNLDMMDKKCEQSFGTLKKFQSLLISGQSVFSENGHDISSEVMAKWWGQDRFGLDVEFIQEMIEQLPDLEVCSQYEPLNKRNNFLKMLTFSNGSLVVRRKDGVVVKEEAALDSLFRRLKRAKISGRQRYPPAGTLLCQRLLPELVGDCYQIWEILWRFHEILGLKETFALEELEEELAIPLSGAASLAQNWEHNQLSNVHRTDKLGGRNPSLSGASVLTPPGENQWAPVPMEVANQKELAEAKSTSVRRGTCFGVALTKVHSSLLTLLIGELQSKVAPLVDPSFDGGELKPKRGKKRDIDSYVPVKRSKLNMLPVNELSWPELARRYILAILSMDGNSDSVEVIARESGKVFRCLQGDGGLLCGSLSGVAGMEADALLLAEASKQIFGFLSRGNDVLTIEGEEYAQSSASEIRTASEPCLPDWAKALEPVKKLPTNVGTRIRKCVYDALSKHPPEWARKRLEHSISKEVYKGNASGPTKKAVISVLADASTDKFPQKPDDGKKKNSVVTVSDILMKQCRIVLRHAAAADDSKVFCNLLGRKLVNSCDNDDEGLLGSPAMVSRQLDFRTIDLRLAAGAYGGFHEAFLDDVHELWDNLRSAFGDQPDLVELADKLSENFESLFAEKVIPLVHQLGEYTSLESLSAEKKKELSDLVSSISVLPKAPWERITMDGSEQSLLSRRRRGRRYQGEVTRDYLEALSHLASVMEEKEYWEYSIDERIFLLKFLCDELLNSAIIRQHLEQCAETSLELQQKLRSLSLEYKALKSREEFLVRAIKTDAAIIDRVAEFMKEGFAPAPANDGSLILEKRGERSNHLNIASEPQAQNGFQKELSYTRSKKNHVCDDQSSPPSETNGEFEDAENAQGSTKLQENLSSSPTDVNNSKSSEMNELPASDPKLQDKDLQREALPEERNIASAQHPDNLDEPNIWQVELNSVKNEISRLQSLMSSLQLQFLKQSIRREFLGSDSLGRMYWAAAIPGNRLRFVVDGSLATKIIGKAPDISSLCDGSVLEGSKARCPYWYDSNDVVTYPPLISYQSEAEIEELIGWLTDDDPKERALKDAILYWRKFRSQDLQDCREHALDESLAALPLDFAVSDHPATKAALLLESKYGPFLDSLTHDMLNKHEEKGYLSAEEKIYRCICLEPVLPARVHCLFCHKTFLTLEDLEAHKEGRCSSASSDHEKGKEILDSSREKGKGAMLERKTFPGLSSKLIMYKNECSMCPYDIEEISSQFITKDSNRELVTQIGLIGSNGVPSFVPSRSPYLDDSTAMLIPKSGAGILPKDLMDVDGALASLEKRYAPNARMVDSFSARTVSEKSASKNSIRATSRCHKEKEGAPSRDIPTCRCVVPSSSLRPLVGEASNVLKRLKLNLLDMEAALCEEAFRPSRAHMERRWAWRSFVKSAQTIFEIIQATIVFEDMIKTQYLRNEWWYWSSLSAAVKTSTISSLALRVYALDSSIIYEKNMCSSDSPEQCKPDSMPERKPESASDTVEKAKASRKSSRKRKELEG